MKYLSINHCDVANGPGVRVSLFVSGCRHHCEECFNKDSWNFNKGRLFTPNEVDSILKTLDSPFIKGLSILGGEPLELENQFEIYNLILKVKEKYPDKDIWLWTGFIYEDILNNNKCRANSAIAHEILRNINVLVDGPYISHLKDTTLKFRGSSNQRILNLN